MNDSLMLKRVTVNPTGADGVWPVNVAYTVVKTGVKTTTKTGPSDRS